MTANHATVCEIFTSRDRPLTEQEIEQAATAVPRQQRPWPRGVVVVWAYASAVFVCLLLWAVTVIAGLRLLHWAWP
jgi:hypothetical protein